MNDLERRFDEVVAKIKALPKSGPAQPSNDLKLRLYGLFRQAEDGDAQGEKPGMFDLVGQFKRQAWERNEGMSRDEAMRKYIAEVEAFAEQNGAEV